MHIPPITTRQAKEIALCIYKDIPAYIKRHEEEYKAFLQEEMRGNTNEY